MVLELVYRCQYGFPYTSAGARSEDVGLPIVLLYLYIDIIDIRDISLFERDVRDISLIKRDMRDISLIERDARDISPLREM